MPLVALRDGTVVRVRPMSGDDGEALVRFHSRLTGETTRLRFFILHPELTRAEVERFTHVDHVDREALVVTDGADLLAVGRYDRVPGTGDAEVAFVVTDRWQGLGIGPVLLEHLARRAREIGVTRFVADVLSENRHMREVFHRSGLRTMSVTEAGVVHMELDIAPAPEQARATA